jgi:hypothetical protein
MGRHCGDVCFMLPQVCDTINLALMKNSEHDPGGHLAFNFALSVLGGVITHLSKLSYLQPLHYL